ncbi:MAG TPA: hypothetical protein VFX59_28980 [Polyangiales bacterium]|nr:hypothetical protein [Polyangiales bacterium]
MADTYAIQSAFADSEENLKQLAEPGDRRPDFCAEALSPGVRIGLLVALMTAVGFLFSSMLMMGLYPNGWLDVSAFGGVFMIGATLGLGFFMQLVFGALLGNNARLSKGERKLWYVMFALAGPVSLPLYWFVEVWPVPFQPSPEQRL